MCTPKSCWRVKDASTSYGDDSAGIWPATSFTTRLKAVGDMLVDVEVRRIDGMGGAGAPRLSAGRIGDRRDRGNSGKRAQTRNGFLIVDVDVISVRRDKARKGGGRASPGCCGCQNQSADDGDQDDQDQPGPPATAKLGTEHKPYCAHDDLLTPVFSTELGALTMACSFSPALGAPSSVTATSNRPPMRPPNRG